MKANYGTKKMQENGRNGRRQRECSERENEGEMKSSRIKIIKVGEQKR